jgi:hypothetical protein
LTPRMVRSPTPDRVGVDHGRPQVLAVPGRLVLRSVPGRVAPRTTRAATTASRSVGDNVG